MNGLRVCVQGIGLLGPGLSSWMTALDVLRGEHVYIPLPTVLPSPIRLPPAERRRAGAAVKLALAVADEAVAHAHVDPGTLATVFTSSSGEGAHCHALCETLAGAAPVVSPTRFTNSVHNAAAGCWHIAVASRASSTSLCAFDGSFGAGLIEAATSVQTSGRPVLLVASDSPYPEPLNSARPLPDHFGVALLLAPSPNERTLAELRIALTGALGAASGSDDAALDALRRAIPAAAALPLLRALARGGPRQHRIALDYLPSIGLQIEVVPVEQPASARHAMNAPLTLTRDGIAALIPHSGAMCLLARLERWDAQTIVCIATNHRDAAHPLRTRSGLLATCAIEYAAQAMALHGALVGRAAGTPAMPGYLASARGVQLHVLRLDDLPPASDAGGADELRIEATRQAGDARQILYAFQVSHAGRPVAEGRAAVVLDTALAA